MKQEKYKVQDPKLSPLFVDTEFVPSSMPFFTLYKQGYNIPSVLPYSPDKTFNDLQKILTTKKMPLIPNCIPIKDYKIQINRRYLDGDILVMGKECEIIQVPRVKGIQEQSRQRCEIAFVMLATLEDVLHIQIRRRSQQDLRVQIVDAINEKYDLKLSDRDIQFNKIIFTTKKDSANITEICFNPSPIKILNPSKLVLSNQNVIIIGIDILSDQFDSQCLVRKDSRFMSAIQTDSDKFLRIKTSKGQFRLNYQRLKQYQARQVLQMLGEQNAQRKGLKLPEKILAPTELIHQIGYIFKGDPLINFVDAIVATQDEIFLQEMNKISPLNTIQIKQIYNQEKKSNGTKFNQIQTRIVSLFCSQAKCNSSKGGSLNYWYHIINQFTRSYFSHVMDFFQNSIASRCVTTVYKQINQLPKYKGDVYRRVNFELNYAQGDIIEFIGFTVATAKRQIINQCNKILYETRPTIIKIIHKNGKYIGQYSYFNLAQVIFVPYTKFKVLQRRQDNLQIKLTLQQLLIQTNLPLLTNVVLWLDKKGSDEAKRTFKQINKIFQQSIRIFQLQSTDKFVQWIQKNKKLASSQLANITIVTNMFRIQNQKQNPNAGVETILKGKQLIPSARYIVFVGQTGFANKKLAEDKIDVDYFVTSNSLQVLQHLIYHFTTGFKNKKPKNQKVNKIPKQDWRQFFPDIFDQNYKKDIKIIKQPKINQIKPIQKQAQLIKYKKSPQKQAVFVAQKQKIEVTNSVSSPKNYPQKLNGAYNNFNNIKPSPQVKSQKPSAQVNSQILQDDPQIDYAGRFPVFQAQKNVKKQAQQNLFKIGTAVQSKILSNIPIIQKNENQGIQ